MNRLILTGVAVAALGSIAWGVGSIAAGEAASRWIEARNADGWVAFARDISVTGFPTQFETRFTDLDLADPETGLAFSTPLLQFEQSVFRLDRIEAHLPEEVMLGSPVEQLTLTHSGLSASLDVQPTNRFALDAMTATLADLSLSSTEGWSLTLSAADISVTRRDEMAYDLAGIARSMRPPDGLRDLLDPAGLLPDIIDNADATLSVAFDRPWDLDAIEQARPQAVQIDIAEISAAWGDMLFRTSGSLDVTPGGVPEGELALRAENWRAMLDLAVNAGLVPQQFQGSAVTMLEVLAGLSGQPENIDATLNFSNGRIFLGPIPLGPAPNLRLR